MWQQVSGQINTRFPGFLWCHNPGCGGHWPWGGPASCFLALFFQKQLHLWIWQHWAQANYLYIKKERERERRVCAINLWAPTLDPLLHTWGASSLLETGMCRICTKVFKEIVNDLKLKSCNIWRTDDSSVNFSLWMQHVSRPFPLTGSQVEQHELHLPDIWESSAPQCLPADFTHPV